MDKEIEGKINKLHEPFDETFRDEGSSERESHIFPIWLYARRLDEVFANNWSSEIREVEIWGQTFLSCTIGIALPDGSEVQRSGIPQSKYPFADACELLGVGGVSGSILSCSRQLNKIYGLDWDIELKYLEEVVVCEISIGVGGGKVQTRSGIGNSDDDAFINACEMFGINPFEDEIPF